MNLKLNSTEVGMLLSIINYYIDPDKWATYPFPKIKQVPDAQKLFNKINKQCKEDLGWIKKRTR